MKIQEIINNKNEQIKKLEQMFVWLKNRPFDSKISSMQGDNLFLTTDYLKFDSEL